MIKIPRYALLALRDMETGQVLRKTTKSFTDQGIFKTWTTASGIVTFTKQFIASQDEELRKLAFFQGPGSYGWNHQFGTPKNRLPDHYWSVDYEDPTPEEVEQYATWHDCYQNHPKFLALAERYGFMVMDLVPMTQEIINARAYFESRS